jgi:hypothetical protein
MICMTKDSHGINWYRSLPSASLIFGQWVAGNTCLCDSPRSCFLVTQYLTPASWITWLLCREILLLSEVQVQLDEVISHFRIQIYSNSSWQSIICFPHSQNQILWLPTSPLAILAFRNRMAPLVSSPCTWHICSHRLQTCVSFCDPLMMTYGYLMQVTSIHNHTKIHLLLQMNSCRESRTRKYLHSSYI